MDIKKPEEIGGRSWWNRRTKMERCLLVSVGFLTAIAIILIATTTLAMARPKALKRGSQELSTEVCNSTVCHERAQLILQSYG
ncbi:hypothetical protein MRX96_024103 [Rhipicephalus microplus]